MALTASFTSVTTLARTYPEIRNLASPDRPPLAVGQLTGVNPDPSPLPAHLHHGAALSISQWSGVTSTVTPSCATQDMDSDTQRTGCGELPLLIRCPVGWYVLEVKDKGDSDGSRTQYLFTMYYLKNCPRQLLWWCVFWIIFLCTGLAPELLQNILSRTF